ncbi:MAG TPA: SDR family oxidoreductase [Kofleriaceae bacterium]|jgi:NAD(P)-dependent dehydrogenase (short-subunit alcohol dehydrogenase family)|nr:SDR family oxidoreductase [Kofleriaceae bacterium]
MRVVVTGANRGIGLELARQLARRGDQVEAGVRDPSAAGELAGQPGVRVHALDVADAGSVKAFAAAVGSAPIDMVFNVAGVIAKASGLGQLAEDLTLAEAARVFDVNALGALRVTIALLPAVRKGTAKKLVHVTSGMGSIEDNKSGGAYAYRMAKVALNMMSRSLSVDLRADGITSVVINPGWVKTDMGGASAPTPVAESVAGILREVDRATLADSGEFLNWKGNRYPW